MISLIISMILSILNFIVNLIIQIIMAIFPNFELNGFALGISAFFNMLGNAVNLTYFVFGNACFIIIDILLIIYAIKIIVLPVIVFIRKVVLRF